MIARKLEFAQDLGLVQYIEWQPESCDHASPIRSTTAWNTRDFGGDGFGAGSRDCPGRRAFRRGPEKADEEGSFPGWQARGAARAALVAAYPRSLAKCAARTHEAGTAGRARQ